MHIYRLALVFFLVLFTPPAFAYLDPNTGGFLFQLLAPLAAIALSVWMFVADQAKAIWRSFRGIFSRKTNREKRKQ